MTTATTTASDTDLYYRILTYLNCLSGDELRVVERVTKGLADGRKIYGPLHIASDTRDFLEEFLQEVRDALIYLMCYVLQRGR